MDILWKIGTQGISTKGRFSREETFKEEQKQLQTQIETLPEGSAEREQLQIQKDREKAMMGKQEAAAKQEQQLAELQEEYRPSWEPGAYWNRMWKRASEAYNEYDSVIMGTVGAGVGVIEQLAYNIDDINTSIWGKWDERSQRFIEKRDEIIRQTQQPIDEAEEKLNELKEREEKYKAKPTAQARPIFDSSLEPSDSNIAPIREATTKDTMDIAAAIEKHNKPLLQKLDKLNLLEDIAIKLGYNNEHLASIDKSNANMERSPVAQTSIYQGGTNITFGGGSSSYKNGRKAFNGSEFSAL
jgi:hypothetical protein